MSTEKKLDPCPKCGGETRCIINEVGGADAYIDEYSLICDTCGELEKQTKSGGYFTGENEETYCPFCDKSSSFHENS